MFYEEIKNRSKMYINLKKKITQQNNEIMGCYTDATQCPTFPESVS